MMLNSNVHIRQEKSLKMLIRPLENVFIHTTTLLTQQVLFLAISLIVKLEDRGGRIIEKQKLQTITDALATYNGNIRMVRIWSSISSVSICSNATTSTYRLWIKIEEYDDSPNI